MAQRKSSEVCDRDLSPTPATDTIRFTYLGVEYELNLCDTHAKQFDREMAGWTRVAREVTTGGAFDDAGQWRDLLERESEHRREYRDDSLPYAATFLRHGEDEDDDLVGDQPAFDQWGLTDHAKERQLERGFTHDEVMLAVTAPERVYLDRRSGYRRHLRGRVVAVVYPEHRAVLTVMFANRQDYLAHLKQKEQHVVCAS